MPKLVNTPLHLANFPFDEIPKEEYDVKETHGATAGLVVGAIAVTAAGVAIEATLGPVNY